MNKLDGDVRDIFFNNIKKIFFKNNKNYILTNDSDVFALKSLRNNRRFIDAGVAEQNLINISAGLAKFNKLPIVYGFCSFLTFRCYEQLRFNIASHNLNVKIVGIGPGFSFSYDGPTHHGTQDVYLMYLIPEFEIYNLSDNNLANKVSKSINKLKGPTYIRIDKGDLNYNKKIKYDLKKGFELIFKSENKKILIITTGIICKNALNIAEDCKNISVLNFFKFRNFDEIKLINELKKNKKIIIYDESSANGGVIPIINNFILKKKLKLNIEYMASLDKQIFLYAKDRDILHQKLKIGPADLKRFIKKL